MPSNSSTNSPPYKLVHMACWQDEQWIQQLLSQLCFTSSDLQTLTGNSTLIKSGQTETSVSFAVEGGKKWLFIRMKECRFVLAAQNQSSAGEMDLVLHPGLFSGHMKRFMWPSVCSFVDKLH